MILEPLFGLSLVLSISLDLQTPAAETGAWAPISTRQRDAKLLPLVREATNCIVRRVYANPRYIANLRPGEINDLIVDSMAGCI